MLAAQMIGASGRIFMAGETADLKRAQKAIEAALAAIEGRKS